MDAAKLLIRRSSLSLAFALLIPAAAFAQPVFVSPATVTLVGQTGTLTVSSTGGTIASFTATVSYTNVSDENWLCINPLNGFGSNESATGGPTPTSFTLSVCGTPSISVTTHTANVTLAATDSSGAAPFVVQVSYTVGSGGSGGSGSVTANPASITETLSYGGSATVYVTLSTSSNVPISFTLPAVPSWINVYQSSGNTLSVSSAQSAVLEVVINGAGLNQATYNYTLAITNQSGTLDIPVTLNNGVSGGGSTGTGSMTVSPSTLNWSYSTTNSGLFPAPTTVSLTSTSGQIGYTATATSSNGWLFVNGAYTTSGTVGVTPLTIGSNTNLAALSPGTYTGTVNIVGSDTSTATVTVTATVTGTGSGTVTITPSPISLSASVNGATTSATVTINSGVSGTLTATITGAGLSYSIPNSNVIAGVATTMTIFGNPSGISNGTVIGTLNVSVAGNTAGAQINFVVGTGSSGGTTTAASPSQLNFYYEQNTSESITQSQNIYLSGSGSYTVTATSNGNWLSATTSSGTLPATISVVANATGLASSTYSGTVTVTNTSTSATSVVNVSLLVQGITTVFTSPGDYVFNYIANVTSVSQFEPIAVYASDGTPVSVNAAVNNPSATPWLTVSGSGSTPLDLDIVTNATGLANGTYVGSVAVTGGYNTATVPVVLVVTGSSVSTGSGSLTLGSSALTLQAQVGGAATSATLSVSASTTTTFTVSSQVTTGGTTWLSVSPFGTTTTPTTLTVTANPAGLSAGNYSGIVSLVVNGVTQSVTVTFVVGASTSGTVVSVTANGGTSTSPSLTFTATAPGASVAPQYIVVSSTAGESSAVFTAAASVTTPSGGSWLSLTTTAGQQYPTPLTVNVSVNTTGLAAGTYTGAITITPTGGTAVTVPVTLAVQGAATIGVSTTALSFAFTAGAAAPNSQSVPVTVTNATSASFTAAASVTTPSGGSWLSISPNSGTAPSSITVSIVTTGLTAGTYTGAITVTGVSPAIGTATIAVSLTVTVPAPTITAVVNAASFVNEPISPGEIITIGGTSIGPATAAQFTVSTNSSTGIQSVPTSGLAGVTVTVSGYAAPVLYVSATQINAIVPYEIAGILKPTVQVTFLGQTSNSYSATSAATAPGIFTSNGSGTGPGAILNANYSSNTAIGSLPGTVVQVFLTGEGQTSNPAGVDGKVTPTGGPYPPPVLPISITVGGLPANYEFAGEAPGLVSGVLQLNVIIPPTLTVTGNVPLVVTIGSVSSQGGVTVNIL